jgi:hypothetical protein
MIPVEWGQGGSPSYTLNNVFNRSVEAVYPNIAQVRSNSGYVPAGCVAIATVQLMAYWKLPMNNYHGRNITADNWNKLCLYSYEPNRSGGFRTWNDHMAHAPADIQQLCSNLILWVGQDIGTKYRPSYEGGSSAFSKDAVNFLGRWGFKTSSKQNYSYTPAYNSVKAGRPVFISGRDGNDNGHQWLIDGYLKQKRTTTITYAVPSSNPFILVPQTLTETIVSNREFFHNNFGWHGTDNGYYTPGVFDASKSHLGELPSNTRSGKPYNFEFDLEMYANIYK